jgi:transposase-like protein
MGQVGMKARQRHRSAEEWRELVNAWKNSGKTREQWCREQGVGRESLRRWTKRLRHSVADAPLVEVSRRPSVAASSPSMRVKITREGEVELLGVFTQEMLAILLRAVRESCGVR